MGREVRRRRVLGAGATLGMGMFAGCPGERTDTGSPNPGTPAESTRTDAPTGTATDTTGDQVATDGSGVLPARYVVTKEAGEVRAYDGDTMEVAFRGAAGTDDGRVLQETLDATDGGRVFIRRAQYTVDRGLRVEHSFTEVRSDFARLTFRDHEPTGNTQVDFAVKEAEHVEVNGLVLDGNKSERTGGTRTADVWGETRFLAFRNCLIFGGKGDRGGAGYGIGEDDNADYVTIDNCIVRDSDRHAYHPSAAHHRIVDSTFVNNAQKGSDVFDLAATEAVVANNHIENNGNGVKLDDTADDQIGGHIVVTGNVFVDNYQRGTATGQLHLSDAAARSAMIEGNTFVLPRVDADETTAHLLIDQDQPMGSLHVRDNHFEGGGPAALMSFTETGRRIETLTVENNTLERIPHDVGLLGSARRLLVRDNLVVCEGSRPGRLAFTAVDGGVVTGNVNYNATIDAPDGTDLVVEGNHRF